MIRAVTAALLLPSLLGASVARAQVASPPQIIGRLVGPNVPKVQPDLASWGTDLGWTVAHEGELQILFGDTDDVFDSVRYGQLHNDDSQGVMPLQRPATGVPPLTFLTEPNDPNVLQRLFVFRNGESLAMGYGQVPVAAYSDGRNIIDAYTTSDGTGGMDIYWNVSTWNPYGVLFLKTNLRPSS